MKRIDPKNLSAQLHYRAAGNPPSTLPESAISNCFPGLEFDFRNLWHHLFEGIKLHEADNYVVGGEGELQGLVGHRLVRVAGRATMKQAIGPQMPGGRSDVLTSASNPGGAWTMEWSNAMANVLHQRAGQKVVCEFTKDKAPRPVWDGRPRPHVISTVIPLGGAQAASAPTIPPPREVSIAPPGRGEVSQSTEG